jgi:hypothetical protein
MKKSQACDELHFEELSVHFLMSALYNPKMIETKGSYQSLNTSLAAKALVEKGCDLNILLNCLSFARVLPDYYPALDVAELRRIARGLNKMRKAMRRIMPSVELPFLTDNDKGSYDVNSEPVSADFHMSRRFRSELWRKERICTHIAELCSRGKIPHRDDIKQLAYLWPALYVKDSTGRHHYALVAELLSDAKFGEKNAAQLSKTMGRVKSKYAAAMWWMLPALYRWNSAAGVLGAEQDEFDEKD